MVEEAIPICLNISGWHLPVVDRTEPRYVNLVTSSTEWPLTDKLDMLESPAPGSRFLFSARTHVDQVLTLLSQKCPERYEGRLRCEPEGQRHLHNPDP